MNDINKTILKVIKVLSVLKKFNFGGVFVFLNLKLIGCFSSVLSFDRISGQSAINV